MSHLLLTPDRYHVPSTVGRTLADWIDAGRLDEVNGHITAERFAVGVIPTGSLEMRIAALVEGADAISTQDVLSWMAEQHLRPARIEELLALAAMQPPIRSWRRLNALGSSIRNAEGEVLYPHCFLLKTRKLRLARVQWEPWWEMMDTFVCLPAD